MCVMIYEISVRVRGNGLIGKTRKSHVKGGGSTPPFSTIFKVYQGS